MQAKFQVATLRKLIECVQFTYAPCFECTPAGIRIQGMDKRHVAMADVPIPLSLMTEYTCTQETRVELNVDRLHRVLQTTDGSEEVELLLTPGTSFISVHVFGWRRDAYYNIENVAGEGEILPLPVTKPKFSFRTTSECFRTTIHDAVESMGLAFPFTGVHLLTLSMSPSGGVIVKCNGGEKGTTGFETLMYTSDVSSPPKAVHVKYELIALWQVITSCKISSGLTVEFDDEGTPLTLRYDNVTAYVAPAMLEEDAVTTPTAHYST